MRFNLSASNTRSAIRLVLLAAIGFGLMWEPQQFALVMGAVEGILGLIRFRAARKA